MGVGAVKSFVATTKLVEKLAVLLLWLARKQLDTPSYQSTGWCVWWWWDRGCGVDGGGYEQDWCGGLIVQVVLWLEGCECGRVRKYNCLDLSSQYN